MSSYHASEMAWCAGEQLRWFGRCGFRFFYGVLPRCALCPLFERERAVRDLFGENPQMIELRLPPGIRALLGEQGSRGTLDPEWEVPDRLPAEWGNPED